ncbi:MAG: peptidoglycan recognition protein family protein [Candidatus Thorarchaeota archaeon]
MNHSIIINGEDVGLPNGVLGSHYKSSLLLPHFKHKPRRRKLKHLVLHETAGNTARGCMRTLVKKGYGVHLILDRKGVVTCHGDLATEVMIHANQLNKTSIGIEVVNPYAPKIAAYDFDSIPAEWWCWCPDKKDRQYVLPTDAQLDTLYILIPWLCEKLGIPYVFPTWYLNPRCRKRKRPSPGVVAHRDFAKHADGRYLLEWLMLGHRGSLTKTNSFHSLFTKEQS